MKGLRKMLLKEKKRLESILEMTRNQLIDAPGGTLQISKTGKWVQYYHYMNQWLEQEYQKKGFQEGTPVILSERGERVRSKSEKILADYFYRHDIPYKYECPLHLSGVGVVYPDFTFLSAKIGQEVYWEHEGMIDEEIYAQNAVRKIHTYEKNGIYPGERLILTFETKKSILDTRMIDALVYRYL